jgi:hypothetical protein
VTARRALLLFLVLALVLPAACGRKKPPRWVEPQAPPPPANLTALHREESTLLRWEYPGSSGLEEFVVERARESGHWKEIAVTKDRFYEDRARTPGACLYRVAARGKNGLLSPYAGPVTVGPAPVLQPPADFGFQILDDAVLFSWSYAGEARGFRLYESGTSGAYRLPPLLEVSRGESSVKVPPRTEEPVFYVLRAFVRSGAVLYEGAPSSEVAVRPEDYVPVPPKGVEAVGTETGVLVYWKESPESWVSGYSVYRALPGKPFFRVGATRTPAFRDESSPPRGTLYEVRALGPVVPGPPSGAAGLALPLP